MMCPYLLISINELLISIIPFIDINKYGLNVKTAAHTFRPNVPVSSPSVSFSVGHAVAASHDGETHRTSRMLN